MQLVHYEAACREIALANTIDEAKDWGDKAEALRAYARQAHNTDMEVQVAEIKLRALRRMGELSKALETAESRHRTTLPNGGKSKSEQLDDAGVSTSAAHRAEQLADIPADEFEANLAKHRDSQKPATQKSVLPKKTYKKINQKRNINKFLKGIEMIAGITGSAEFMVSEMNDNQSDRVNDSINRAAILINQIKVEISNATN